MMRNLKELFSRAFMVLRRRKLDHDFEEEFATHLALLAEQNERRGLPQHEARRQAILQMGGINATKDLHREARGLPRFERCLDALQSIRRDLAHAARSLASARAFTVICVVSLGVGIGAFVALVTVTRGLTEPARGINTDRLVELLVMPQGPLRAKAGKQAIEEWSYPDFEELRHANAGVAITGWTAGISESGTPESDAAAPMRVLTLFVSANYFSTFGVSLVRGPGFDPAVDDEPAAEPRVVISFDFWKSRFGSASDVVGKTLTLDGVPHVVAGIAPDGFRGHFHFLEAPSSLVFVPLERHPRLRADPSLRLSRNIDWVHIHGRLAPGVDVVRANAAVSAVMADLAKEYPATNEFKAASVEPYFSQGAAQRRSNERRKFYWFLGLAGMVLLIVCLNISGMMLVRSARRERELCIREALGAGRRRLMQYLLFEAGLLAFMGGGLSLFVLFGIPAVVAWWMGVPVPPEIDFDAVNIAISIGLCLSVSLLFGLLPAIRFSRPNLLPMLKDDAGGGGRKVSRIHRVATTVQVGVAIPFLVISGVLLDRVRTADFGFETDGLVAARLLPAAGQERRVTSKEETNRGSAGFRLHSVRDNLMQVGGVASVTMADGMPIDFARRNVRVAHARQRAALTEVATRGAHADGVQFATAHVTRVAEGYLETIGTPLLRGRSITAEDRAGDARVAVISEPLANQLFPNADAIGERLTFALEAGREQEFTIVGVSKDFATSQLTTERPQMLLPLREETSSRVFLIARGAAGDEARLMSAIEKAIKEFDPDFIPKVNGHPAQRESGIVVTGKKLVAISKEDLIAESASVAGAGGIVLVLAALGVIGVVGFMAATRTREIAVRIALGATRPRMLVLLLSDVVKLVLPGVAGGLLVAALLVHMIHTVAETPLQLASSSLGVLEPLIYVAACVIAVLVALLACLPAARRGASVQPMIALRAE
jgi:predicted permease